MIKLTIGQIYNLYCQKYGEPHCMEGYGLDPSKENGIIIRVKNGIINYAVTDASFDDWVVYTPNKKKYAFVSDDLSTPYDRDDILRKYCQNMSNCIYGCLLYRQKGTRCIKSYDPDHAIQKLIEVKIIEEV